MYRLPCLSHPPFCIHTLRQTLSSSQRLYSTYPLLSRRYCRWKILMAVVGSFTPCLSSRKNMHTKKEDTDTCTTLLADQFFICRLYMFVLLWKIIKINQPLRTGYYCICINASLLQKNPTLKRQTGRHYFYSSGGCGRAFFKIKIAYKPNIIFVAEPPSSSSQHMGHANNNAHTKHWDDIAGGAKKKKYFWMSLLHVGNNGQAICTVKRVLLVLYRNEDALKRDNFCLHFYFCSILYLSVP